LLFPNPTQLDTLYRFSKIGKGKEKKQNVLQDLIKAIVSFDNTDSDTLEYEVDDENIVGNGKNGGTENPAAGGGGNVLSQAILLMLSTRFTLPSSRLSVVSLDHHLPSFHVSKSSPLSPLPHLTLLSPP
jgi:hypothetical protein